MKLSRPLYQLTVGFAEIEKCKEHKETQGAKLYQQRKLQHLLLQMVKQDCQ